MAVFLITGVSGVGKTSVMNFISEQNPYVDIGECISHTTRPMREGEEEGTTYHYVSEEEFSNMNDEDEFAEVVSYSKNFYGISKSEINRVLDIYKHAYIILDYNGYGQVKDIYPEAIGIFLHASKEDCRINMNNRGDAEDNINLRLTTYEAEMSNKHDYDYVVKNVSGKKWLTAKIIENIIMQQEN